MLLYILLITQAIVTVTFYWFQKTVITNANQCSPRVNQGWNWKDRMRCSGTSTVWPLFFPIFLIMFKKEIRERFSKEDDVSQG